MKLLSELKGYENKEDYLLLRFDDGDLRICYMAPRIVRLATSFDETYRELSYNLVTTAWEDGADDYFGDRKSVV